MNATLGAVVTRTDIRSSLGPFHTLPGYCIRYPQVVVQALANLYREYNMAFGRLVDANREWDTDYQYALFGPGGTPVNFAVQIDLVGLTTEFLAAAEGMPVHEVTRRLRGMIFEIENSIAMYQLLERGCSNGHGESFFKRRWRATLQDLRRRFGKPIALLAVTTAKQMAMMQTEFGRWYDGYAGKMEPLADDEVLALSGFDRFFGPADFLAYLERNSGRCDYLLFARTSDPVARLRKPGTPVEHPLLGDPELRRIIKAHTLTFNVDAPDMEPAGRINDTKGYMAPMGMAYEIGSVGDLLSAKVQAHLAHGRSFAEFQGPRLSDDFAGYLRDRGIDPCEVESGQVHLRAKPAKGTYGCYGHVRGPLPSTVRFRKDLAGELRKRGRYVVQPELTTPCITNTDTDASYTYIDRVFLATDVEGGQRFLGGFRDLMPTDSVEAHEGRIHGNHAAVWAEITPA